VSELSFECQAAGTVSYSNKGVYTWINKAMAVEQVHGQQDAVVGRQNVEGGEEDCDDFEAFRNCPHEILYGGGASDFSYTKFFGYRDSRK